MHTEYKQKELVTDDMKDNLKYSIQLLALLKNSNVSNALYDKIVDLLSCCDKIYALCNIPKRDTVLK